MKWLKVSEFRSYFLSIIMKKNLTLILGLCSLLSFSQIPTTGLVAKYTFNTSLVHDDHTGTYTLTNNGVSGGYDLIDIPLAAYFNGNSYMSVNNSAFRTGSYSMSAWFKYTNLQTYSTIGVIRYNAATSPYNSINMYTGTGVGNKLALTLKTTGSSETTISGTSVLLPNIWYLATSTYDAATGVARLYLNGSLQASATLTGSISYNPTNNPLVIGNVIGTANNGFTGNIDDFLYYNRALTPTEIYSMYSSYFTSSNIVDPTNGITQYEIGRFNFNGFVRDNSSRSLAASYSAPGNSNPVAFSADNSSNAIGAITTSGTQYAPAANNTYYTPDSAITITAWVKRTSATNYGMAVNKRRHGTVAPYNSYGLGCGALYPGYANKLMGTISTSNSADVMVGDVNTIVDGNWYHVALTYSSGKGELKFYVNGNLTETKTVTGNIVHSTLNPMIIGGANLTNHEWNGQIDNVRLFAIALSAQQVDSIRNLAPATSGLISHYPMGKNPYDVVSGFDLGAIDLQTTDRFNTFGNATSFNGSTVLVPDYSPLHKSDTAITIEAWVYSTFSQQYNTIGGIRANQASVPYNSVMLIGGGNNNSGKIQGVISTVNNSDVIVQSTNAIQQSAWTHVGLTYSAAQGKVKLFVNGVKVDEQPATGNIFYTAGTTQKLSIGNASSNAIANQFFNGKIDEFKLYNRAKTEAEFANDVCIDNTPAVSNTPILCHYAPVVTLTASPAGGTFSGASLVGNTFNPSANGIGTFPFTYQIWKDGCYGETNQSIIVIGNPTVAVSVSGNSLTSVYNNATSVQWYNCNSQTNISGETNNVYFPSANGNYAIIVHENGCADTSACVNFITTGVIDLQSTSLNIHPNPARDVLYIDYADNMAYTIRISNLLGETIYEAMSDAKQTSIPVGNLTKGIYLIDVSSQGQHYTSKIVIE